MRNHNGNERTVSDLEQKIKSEFVFLDGATGTNLQRAGMPAGVCPEQWILEHPDVLLSLQRAYVEAGTEILYAPTFSGNGIKLAEYGLAERLPQMNAQLVELTREAAGGRAWVAGDLTMTGRALAPTGDMDFEDLVDVYKEQVSAIAAAGVDLFVVETMMSVQESRAAVLAVKELTDLPVFVTLTLEASGRTLYGTDPLSALITLEALGVSAFGINCSFGPDALLPIVRELAEYAHVPLIAKPNAGMPRMEGGHTVYDMPKEEFASHMKDLAAAGASIVGGCCGTDPTYIAELVRAIPQRTRFEGAQEGRSEDGSYASSNLADGSFAGAGQGQSKAGDLASAEQGRIADGSFADAGQGESQGSRYASGNLADGNFAGADQGQSPNGKSHRRMLSSERGHLEITLDGPVRIVGERINPTGKKALQREFSIGQTELAEEMAKTQAEQGASILDVNVGMVGVDERKLMRKVVESVSVDVDVPLCIDSGNPQVVEEALRRYPGRALVNSVSAEQQSLEEMLPIVKKYGAMFILLPLSDRGIPQSQEERWENIHTVEERALALGFTREDMVVDGLVGSIAAVPSAALDTLETIERCKKEGWATICGLSNISFGLPERTLVNSAFLAMAAERGLTMAIANPMQEDFLKSGLAADLLTAKDGAALRYVNYCRKAQERKSVADAERANAKMEKPMGQVVAEGKAQVTGAQIVGAQIAGTQVAGAQIVGAQVAGAQDGKTQMAGSQVSGMRVSGAQVVGANDGETQMAGSQVSGMQAAETQVVGMRVSGAEGTAATYLREIQEDVLQGRKQQITTHIEWALKEGADANAVLNDVLIPGIQKVGELFNQQKYFLPQLIASAKAMETGVSVLEPILQKEGSGEEGPIVIIATVKGDVHDIGKNLVTMMLKNYGCQVIDLGKDVGKEAIVSAAKEHHADVIGLSALMTTTMGYMKEVIEAVREAGLPAKVIIGGAAVTQEYADEIGADGYSEDAVAAVELVKRLTGHDS